MHIQDVGPANHHTLNELRLTNVPHILYKPDFMPQQSCEDWLSSSFDEWQELFCGTNAQQHDSKPKQVCLHAESAQPVPSQISFDMDSILGFVESPAVASHGIRFYSAPQLRQNVQNNVHITTNKMASNHQRPRLLPSQLRDVPHFIFGRVEGAEFITLHLFFPHLPCQHEFEQLFDLQFSRWFD